MSLIRNWKFSFLLVFGFVGSLMLAACAPAAKDQEQSANSSALTPVSFVTDWKAQAEHGGFYEALAEGLYEKAGLKVTLTQGGPGVNVPQLIAGGAADFGMGSNGFIPLN